MDAVQNAEGVRDVPMDDRRDFDTVTVFYDGVKSEYPIADLDIARQDDGRCDPTDAQVKEALLTVLGATNLDGYEVDRYEKVLNLRPVATLG